LVLAEDAGRNECWEVGKKGCNLPEDGAWANPGGNIVIYGFDPVKLTYPGPCVVNCTNSQNVYSFHNGGANVLFADGSVKFMRASIDINVLVALMTRANGEIIPDGNF
jgi:prepilin-type processing-associated H-X9-DG protein